MSFKNVLKFLFILFVFLFVGNNVFAGTFGYANGGISIESRRINDRLFGSKFYLSERGEIQSINVYVNFGSNGEMKVAIYDNNEDFIVETLAYVNTAGNLPAGWFELTFAENPILEIGNYWLVITGNDRTLYTNYVYFELNTTLETWEDYDAGYLYTNGFPLIFDPNTSAGSRNMAIYGTYVIPATYISIPADFTTSTLAYAGNLFTDLSLVIILTIGLPVGFWVIKKVIALV